MSFNWISTISNSTLPVELPKVWKIVEIDSSDTHYYDSDSWSSYMIVVIITVVVLGVFYVYARQNM